MNYALLNPRRLLLVAALTVFALWNVAPAGAVMSIGPSNGVLRITGDGQDDKIVLKVDSSDPSRLAFDFDNDRVFEGTVPLGSFNSIVFDMGAGNDLAVIDDRGGSFTDKKPTAMFGGDGDDFLQGGKGAEGLLGGDGNDTVFWNAGGGNDVISGDAGSDKVVVRGTSEAETVTASSGESHVHVTLDSALIDLNGVEDLDVLTFGGNDGIIASAGVGTLIKLNLNAGGLVRPDDDVVIGSDSGDVIAGGLGVDRLEGRGGDDLISAGDGSDTLLGGAGKDAMTGGPGADSFECDVVGEALDLESVDFTQGTCSAPETPPVTQPPATEPPAPPVSDQPAAASQPAASGQPAVALGFGRPVVRATREGLRLTLRSTSASALGVSVKVAERFGSSRTLRYRVVRKTIPAGGRVALRLRAPRALRARIARQLDRLGRVVRRPRVTVTNVATAGSLSVRPRLTLRAH